MFYICSYQVDQGAEDFEDFQSYQEGKSNGFYSSLALLCVLMWRSFPVNGAKTENKSMVHHREREISISSHIKAVYTYTMYTCMNFLSWCLKGRNNIDTYR